VKNSITCVNMVIQTSEMASLKRDLDKQKEQFSAAEIKIKWNQNKLKAEQDTHKVCRSTRVLVLMSVCKSHPKMTIMCWVGH